MRRTLLLLFFTACSFDGSGVLHGDDDAVADVDAAPADDPGGGGGGHRPDAGAPDAQPDVPDEPDAAPPDAAPTGDTGDGHGGHH